MTDAHETQTTDTEAHETPDATGADGAGESTDADAPAQTDTEAETVGSDLELRKVAVGVYAVWQETDADHSRRIGSVAKIAEGEWKAYSTTGHASKPAYATRREAADALAAARRR